jgi:hypothetical protein
MSADGRGSPGAEDATKKYELPAAARLASWATPVSTEIGNTLENYLAMKQNMASGPRTAITHPSLQAQLAGWPTTTVMDAVGAARHGYMNDGLERSAVNPRKETLTGHSGTTLLDAARLAAGWATPNARDEKVGSMKTYGERGGGTKGDSLSNQAASLCAAWATPRAEDSESWGMRHSRGVADTLSAQTSLTECPPPTAGELIGRTQIGSGAGTKSTGQLNPAHSRWLMGLPPAWDVSGVTAMQSLPRRQRRSSPRTST